MAGRRNGGHGRGEVQLYNAAYYPRPLPISFSQDYHNKHYHSSENAGMETEHLEMKQPSPKGDGHVISHTKKDSQYSNKDGPWSTADTERFDSPGSSNPPRYPPYRESGAPINRSDTAEERSKPASHPQLMWPRIRHAIREPLSEFMGTFVLIMFGNGVVAQVVLSDNAAGDYQSISWGWGLGVMLGVYTSGLSGAHINPAVTFANCVFRKFPWRKFPVYMVAQVLGAMAASAVVYANYYSAIDTVDPQRTVAGPNDPPAGIIPSAGIFCTYPQPFMTTTGMFFSEFIASTLLMFLIYALKDDGNLGAGNLTPLGLFFVIFGIGACFGWETGYAINLARDFGPRLVSYMVGYGTEVWSAGNYYFWIPVVAPFLGCTFGGFLYDLLLFTGESPVNTPYLGLYRLVPGWRDWDWEKEMPRTDKDLEA